MRRVVSAYLPTWPTDLWRRENAHLAPGWDEPLVTVASDGRRRAVVAVDRAARRLGLRPGMPAAQARALVPDLALVDARPEDDARGLDALVRWCLCRYSPLVAPDPPDGLFFEVGGSSHLFGGEAALLDDVVDRLARRAIRARAAVADTPGAAWAVARFGPRGAVVPPGGQAAALSDLPARALRLDPATTDALARVGIARVGHFAAQPRGPLALRFGAGALLRLDQAVGSAPEPLAAASLPDVPVARLAFAEPISAPETMARVAARLLDMLCADLGLRGVGARRLDLVFRRVDAVDAGLRVGTSRPSRSVPHLMRLIGERLGTVDPGYGVEAASLTASATEWMDERQRALDPEEDAGEAGDVSELVDRLVQRVGRSRVYRLAATQSAVPERSVARARALDAPSTDTWPEDLPRPARLLAPPDPVTALALAPDGPPALVVWRGARHRVARADGPERVHGEWWVAPGESGVVRDYYRVETTEGSRLWVFRDAPASEGGRWWLHGVGEAG